jgi:hypothetical protein
LIFSLDSVLGYAILSLVKERNVEPEKVMMLRKAAWCDRRPAIALQAAARKRGRFATIYYPSDSSPIPAWNLPVGDEERPYPEACLVVIEIKDKAEFDAMMEEV